MVTDLVVWFVEDAEELSYIDSSIKEIINTIYKTAKSSIKSSRKSSLKVVD